MSERAEVDIIVAVHVDKEGGRSIRVSDDGDDARGIWINNSQISMKHYNLQTIRGRDRNGAVVQPEIAIIRIPEWLAKKEGLI